MIFSLMIKPGKYWVSKLYIKVNSVCVKNIKSKKYPEVFIETIHDKRWIQCLYLNYTWQTNITVHGYILKQDMTRNELSIYIEKNTGQNVITVFLWNT